MCTRQLYTALTGSYLMYSVPALTIAGRYATVSAGHFNTSDSRAYMWRKTMSYESFMYDETHLQRTLLQLLVISRQCLDSTCHNILDVRCNLRWRMTSNGGNKLNSGLLLFDIGIGSKGRQDASCHELNELLRLRYWQELCKSRDSALANSRS